MKILTFSQLEEITGGRMDPANAEAFLTGLNRFGPECGLSLPHRLAQYVAQMCHETMAFRHDEEIWGPTPAQVRYDTRTDLGNTPARDGDGFRYRGRGGIMITGRYNYAEFTKWARKLDPDAPDFEATPSAVLTDPWEGLVPIWYWDTRSLNRLADKARFKLALKGVTRKINGGLNGYRDRQRYYERAALVLLGRAADDVAGFQVSAELKPDGVCGPLTRQAMHEALLRCEPLHHRSASSFQAVLSRLLTAFLNLFSKGT
ncbi:MAG: glycoside hydrolase family 19 protein [Rhodobacteraceae bacterium]|nr:glycoside hydrolase family 19 protein [Paracoccaceae bacterium]